MIRKFESLVQAKNNADMLVHATRKSISEAGDKLTDEEKDAVESSTVKLEEAIKQDSLEAIEEATKNLNEVLTPLTQKLYPQAEEGSPDSQKRLLAMRIQLMLNLKKLKKKKSKQCHRETIMRS